MPKKTDAKQRLIRTAGELFRARGYHGVGLAEILQESGAPKGSFYYHFPGGKDELALAVLESGGRFIGKMIDKSFEGAASVDEAVDLLVKTIARAFEESGFELGCPVTSLLLELTPSDEKVRQIADAVLADWMDRMVQNAVRLGVPVTELSAYKHAFRVLLISIEGGWIVSRTAHDVEPIMLAQQIYKNALNARLKVPHPLTA